MLIVVRPRETPRQRVGERALGFGVDRARGFVEHEQSGVAELGARQGDELALAHRQRLAPLAHHGREAVGQAHQPPVEPEPRRRRVRCRRRSRPGAAMRTLSAIVASNRKPSCGTMRIARRREAGSTSRRSLSPMRT